MAKSKTKTNRYMIAGVWATAIIGLAMIVWWQTANRPPLAKDRPPEPETKATPQIEMSQDTLEQIYQLKNLGLAQIENERYADAEATLLKLKTLLPPEPFVERNLLIAAILRMQAEQNAEPFGADKALRDSIVSHNIDIPFQPEVSHYLIGQLHDSEKNPEAALDEYRQATVQDPDFTPAWYLLSQRMKRSSDPESRRNSLEMLQKAAGTMPENLFLQLELLQARMEFKAPGSQETFDSIWKLVEPFRTGIEQHSRVNLNDVIEQGKSAVLSEKWEGGLRSSRILTNVLRPQEVYQADLALVQPHLLTFLIRELNQDLPRLSITNESAEPLTISWEKWKPTGIPSLTDIQDLSVEDLDLDGRLDLCVLRLKSVEAYTRIPESNDWKKLFEIELPQGYQRLILMDFDNDFEENRSIPVKPETTGATSPCQAADLDILVYGSAGIATIENRFNPMEGTRQAVLHPVAAELNSQSAVRTLATADLDGDGDLDLAIGRTGTLEIWANRGGMDFFDISSRSNLPPDCSANVIVIADGDRDVDQDIAVLGGPVNGILENLRHGQFRWVENQGRTSERLAGFVDAEIGDQHEGQWVVFGVDGNDVYDCEAFRKVTGWRNPPNFHRLSRDLGARKIRLADLDNDGREDFIAYGDSGLHVELMRRSSTEEQAARRRFWNPVESLKIEGDIRGADYGDLDRDGDLDLIWGDAEGLHCATNQSVSQQHWINVSLVAQQIKQGDATPSGRVNSHGIGSIVELRMDDDIARKVVRRPRTHFGLGNRKQVDVCRIQWANGIPANLIDPQQDQFICEQQTLKGSCPYLYAWNGERMEFVTDLLWGAPIGLQFAEGVLAMPREWEYLKIPGEALREKEGVLNLSITEELWEAAYLDEVKLYAVDHPAEIEIETNEKVGPASVAEHRLFTARQRRLPVAARDSQGNDLLPRLSVKNDNYVPTFHHKLRQGLAEDHYLELDFGKLPKFEQLHLYLTGWLYPTDTSINIAVSQDPRLNHPRPPSIQVPDARGEWKEVIPFCGFPGGKTKTVVYDLSWVFLTEDYRIRFTTNMEFYWDAAYFTLDEPGEALTMTELPLQQASLRSRGYSARLEHPHNGPERYDYSSAATESPWPPFLGKLTRFGNVKELLTSSDDQLVVMASGDEVQLNFAAPSKPLPPGWKRDFILYNVGWDKDADLNTVSGAGVEPLPFRGMDAYPPVSPDQSPQGDSSESRTYQDYLSTYQTRTHSPRRFWSHDLSSTVNPRP